MPGPFVTNSLNFPNLTSKASPVGADILLIADSAAGNAVKQCLISSLPFAPVVGGAIVNVTTSTQQLAKETTYFVNYTGGVCTLTVPTTANSAQGDWILIIGGESASNPFVLGVNATQQFRCLNQTTTVTTGTLTASTNFDWALLRCDALSGGLTWAAWTNNSFTGS